MRIAFVGSSSLAVLTARSLLESGHEVVIVERDEERIEELQEELDCGFLRGDGSRPAVLREIGPESTDFLFCLSGSDQANILAALVGRSLEFGRVVAMIEDPDYEAICVELGLQDTIIPDRQVAEALRDMVEGRETPTLSTVVRGGVRFFTFVAPEDARTIADLDLPEECRVVAVTREGDSFLADPETSLRKGDEVTIATREEHIEPLMKRFEQPRGSRRAER